MPVLFHSTLQLKCFERGDPEPNVTWNNNGTQVANSNTLVITNVTFKDAGQYGCFAMNRAGNVSGKIWIDVIGKSSKSHGTQKNWKPTASRDQLLTMMTELNNPYRVRGPAGIWKFNNSLLDDEGYLNLIREHYSSISEKYSAQEDKWLKWELVKMELRGLTIPYAKNKAKNSSRKDKDLQKRLSDLGQLISSAGGVDSTRTNYLTAEYNQLKQELCLIYGNKGKGSIVRSKARWIEQDEKPTKYLFNLEKRDYTV